jgi:hypothetical protein
VNSDSLMQQGTDNALDREQFLEALDSEIAHLESARASTGLTRWGIIVSLSALLWLGLQILGESHYQLKNVAGLTIALTILWDILAKVIVALDAPMVSRQPVRGGFISLTQMIGAARSLLLFVGLKEGLLLVAAFISNLPGFTVAQVYLAAGFLLTAIGFVFTYVDILPIPVIEPHTKGRSYAICYQSISWLARVVVAGSLVWAIFKLRSTFSTDDVRLGILATACLYLLSLLVHDRFSTNYLAAFRKVRQNLAFNHISLDEAREQADLLTTFGGTTTATIHREPEEILASIDAIRSQFRKIESLQGLILAAPMNDPQLTFDSRVQDEERKRASKIIPTLFAEACSEHDRLKDRVEQYIAYGSFLLYLSTSGARQVQPLAEKLKSAIQPLTEERERINAMVSS